MDEKEIRRIVEETLRFDAPGSLKPGVGVVKGENLVIIAVFPSGAGDTARIVAALQAQQDRTGSNLGIIRFV